MAVPRASANLGRTVLRRASAQTRSQAWKRFGQRQYATGHATKSSELPWIIGSVAFTVPAAVWLMGQAPKKGDHHGEAHHDEKEAAADDDTDGNTSGEDGAQDTDAEKEDQAQKDGDDKNDEGSGSDSDKSNDESSDEASDKESDGESTRKSDKGAKKGSGDGSKAQMSEDGSGKGPGEGQKGPRRPAETKGEKDSHKDQSGAQHPYLDDDEKSKKGEGLKDTMKIHGTVDSNRPLR